MRTVRNLSPLRKLCSKIDPVSRLRSLSLMTAPARASLQAVEERKRVMRESPWVDDDARRTRRLLLQEVDDLALSVALKEAGLHLQLARLDSNGIHQLGQRVRPVDVWLSFAEKVQVGAVDDQDSLHAR